MRDREDITRRVKHLLDAIASGYLISPEGRDDAGELLDKTAGRRIMIMAEDVYPDVAESPSEDMRDKVESGLVQAAVGVMEQAHQGLISCGQLSSDDQVDLEAALSSAMNILRRINSQ